MSKKSDLMKHMHNSKTVALPVQQSNSLAVRMMAIRHPVSRDPFTFQRTLSVAFVKTPFDCSQKKNVSLEDRSSASRFMNLNQGTMRDDIGLRVPSPSRTTSNGDRMKIGARLV
jgi:hypothetical protein